MYPRGGFTKEYFFNRCSDQDYKGYITEKKDLY